MRLKAPIGAGNPSVGGIAIAPGKGGLYEVDARTGAHLIESFGFVDVDAPKAKAVAAPALPEDTAALKERAEKAEAALADARQVLTGMDEKVAQLETKLAAAEADAAQLRTALATRENAEKAATTQPAQAAKKA